MLQEVVFRPIVTDTADDGAVVYIYVEGVRRSIYTRSVTKRECWNRLGHSQKSAFVDLAFAHLVEDGDFESLDGIITPELFDMLRTLKHERLTDVPPDERTYRFVDYGRYGGQTTLGYDDYVLTNDKTDVLRREKSQPAAQS